MHLFPREHAEVPEFVSDACQWAQEIVLEHDNVGFAKRIRGKASIPLRQSLSHGAWQTLLRAWPQDPGKFPPLASVLPWAALILGPTFRLEAVLGCEHYIKGVAKAKKKPIGYIETLDEFAASLAAIPHDVVVCGIEHALADLPRKREGFRLMHSAWANRDEASFAALFEANRPQSRSISEAVFTQRNKRWASRIPGLQHSEKRTLFVVGAGHLFGPGNLFESAGVRAVAL